MSTGADITGLDGLLGDLAAFAAEASDLRTLEREFAEEVGGVERAWFDSEGEGTWPRLNPKYAARKERLYGDKALLRASDRLYRAFTEGDTRTVHAEHDEIVFEVAGEAGRVGRFHQYGTRLMPARPPLAPAERFDRIAELLDRQIVAVGRRHGFDVR